MSLAVFMALSIAVFFLGWLINHVRGWGLYVAAAGAVMYIIGFILAFVVPLR